MIPNLIEILSGAIANKRRVSIRYKGQEEPRIIEPHILYKTRGGRYVVESYQVRGYSSGGRVPPFWRPFQLRKMTTVIVLDELFTPRIVEGFQTIRKLVSGETAAIVELAENEYFYFNSQLYGPPKPEGRADITTRRLRSYA
jgi:hypothetical protein